MRVDEVGHGGLRGVIQRLLDKRGMFATVAFSSATKSSNRMSTDCPAGNTSRSRRRPLSRSSVPSSQRAAGDPIPGASTAIRAEEQTMVAIDRTTKVTSGKVPARAGNCYDGRWSWLR